MQAGRDARAVSWRWRGMIALFAGNRRLSMRARANPTQLPCILIFFCAGFARAQATQPQQEATPKVEVRVDRVLIPVVVRDAQGHAVGDLKEADFQVFDNGKPRIITGFSIETREPGSVQANANAGAAGPAESTAASSPGAPGRITVFVFDDLHSSFEELARVRDAADGALGGALEGSDAADVVSISGKTNSGLTQDRAELEAAIAGLRLQQLYRADTRQCGAIDYYEADLIENKHLEAAVQEATKRLAACGEAGGGGSDAADMAGQMVDSAARRALDLGGIDVRRTYATIAEMVRRLASLPEQKLLILVSPGFLNIEAQSMAIESQILDLAAQSGVTISAIDARGLYTDQASASESGLSGGATDSEFRRNEMRLAEDPMAELADGTGGAFFHDDNDLTSGLKRLAAAPETVYLLEIPLDKGKPDGKYHALKVKVDRDGLQLQTRRGCFSAKPGKK